MVLSNWAECILSSSRVPGGGAGLGGSSVVFDNAINGADYATLVSRGENLVVNGQSQFRIPCTDWTSSAIVLFYEGRVGFDDGAAHKIWCKRSTDQGRTWSAPVLISEVSTGDTNKIGNACSAYDWTLGRLYCIYLESVDATDASPQVWVKWSDDHGATWSGSSTTDLGLEITSRVVVAGANNPVGHTFSSTAWQMVASGCHRGIQLAYQTSTPADNGRLVVPWYHRHYISDPDGAGPLTNTSWAHCIYREAGADGEDATDWGLLGGVSEIEANASNENCLIERTDGTLYMHCRTLSGSSPVYTTSTDGGRTWGSTAAVSGVNIRNVQGSMITLNGNRVICAGPTATSGTSLRRQFGFYLSEDGGATWTGPRLVSYRSAAYSGLAKLSASKWLAVWENGPGGTAAAVDSADTGWAENITAGTFNKAWFDASTRQVPQTLLCFNERAAGKLAITGGPSIKDWSGYRHNAQPVSADSGLAYAADSLGESSLDFDGTNDYVILEDDGLGCYQVGANDSFTLEFCIERSTGSGSSTIFEAGNAASQPYIRVDFTGNKPRLTIKWSGVSPSVTITATNQIATGTRTTFAVQRDVANSVVRLFINGVEDATAVTDTSIGTTLVYESNETILGQRQAATNKYIGKICWLRWTRRALAASELLGVSYVKPGPSALPTYTGQPSTIGSGCALHVPSPDIIGVHYGNLHTAYPTLKPYNAGMPRLAAFDLCGGVLCQNPSNGRSHYAGYDATVGPHWIHACPTGTHVGPTIARIEKTFDTLHAHQTNPTGTLSCFFYRDAAGSNHTLFDNCNGGSGASERGFWCQAKSTNVIEFGLWDGSAAKFIQTTGTGSTVPATTWYFLCITWDTLGTGTPPTVYLCPASNSSVSTVSTTTANWTAFSGTPGSSIRSLIIGGLAVSNSSALIGRIVDPCIWTTALNSSQVQSVFDWTKNHASR